MVIQSENDKARSLMKQNDFNTSIWEETLDNRPLELETLEGKKKFTQITHSFNINSLISRNSFTKITDNVLKINVLFCIVGKKINY